VARLTPLGLGNRDGWGGRQRRSGRWVGRSDQNVVGSPAPTQTSHGEFRDGDAGQPRDNKALFTSMQKLKIFQDSPSHRIFIRMHKVLNIDKNKN